MDVVDHLARLAEGHVPVVAKVKGHVQKIGHFGVALCLDLEPVLLHHHLDPLDDPVVLLGCQITLLPAVQIM